MSIRLLCTADMHLGRRPTRVPEGLDAHALGPAGVWQRLVDQAIERGVDAVLLAGDVADADNRFFEAYRALADGVRRLLERQVPVYAVAGNHDHDVLGRLADQFDGFRLLGRGGRWEVSTIAPGVTPVPPPAGQARPINDQHSPPNDQRPSPALPEGEKTVCRLVGWSFPAGHVTDNPLATFPSLDADLPTVGLLHCDVDAVASRYAPVRLAELTSRPVTAWLLGHTHAPRLLSASPPALYPGSPQGLDPGEPGRRGPWLLTLGDGPAHFEPIPLASLRYEPLSIDLSDHPPREPLDGRLAAAMRAHVAAIRDELGPARAVLFRLTLRGRIPVELRRRMKNETDRLTDEPPVPIGRVECGVESVVDETEPRLPLEELSQSADPLGLLARRLLVLQRRQPEDEYRRLLRAAGMTVAQARAQGAFSALGDHAEPDEEHTRRQLLRAAGDLLDELYAQREVPA